MSARVMCLGALSLSIVLAACSDTTPPTWPREAGIETVDVGPSSVTVLWPVASDDRDVEQYRVLMDGEVIATLGPAARRHVLEGLRDATELEVGVEAVDAAGNGSETLRATVTTTDGTPPRWPSGVQVSVVLPDAEDHPAPNAAAPSDGEGAGEPRDVDVTITWTAAEDNVEVVRYRLAVGETVVAEVDAPSTKAELRVPAPAQGPYLLQAGDAAGNWSGALRASPGRPVEEVTEDVALVDETGERGGMLDELPDPARRRIQLSGEILKHKSVFRLADQLRLRDMPQLFPGKERPTLPPNDAADGE